MPPKHRTVNPGRDPNADLAAMRQRIEELTAIIASGNFWILATDDRVGGGFALGYLAASFASDARFFSEDVFVKGRGLTQLIVAAIAKTRVSPDEIIGFLSGYTGLPRETIAPGVRAGADVFPVNCTAENVVVGCIARIGKGKCCAYHPSSN